MEGGTFVPSIAFEKKRFGDQEIGMNNFAPFFTKLARMAEILQIVHNENTSNVIKNGKGHNVPTTQLATIQQDGPMLYLSTRKNEEKKIKENKDRFEAKLTQKGSKITSFESISQYNPTIQQIGFCTEKAMLSAGIANGASVKESKELKAGELLHNEIMYLFAQGYFNNIKEDDGGRKYIYSQSTANADKNLQTLRGLALDEEITYVDEFGNIEKQRHTLRTIIDASMNGDDSGIFEYYQLHNAKAARALESNICHSYNCAFIDDEYD